VDVTFSHTGKSKQSRIIASLVDILSITGGLLMANNLIKGESLLAGMIEYIHILLVNITYDNDHSYFHLAIFTTISLSC
jgi:hypothetical protein